MALCLDACGPTAASAAEYSDRTIGRSAGRHPAGGPAPAGRRAGSQLLAFESESCPGVTVTGRPDRVRRPALISESETVTGQRRSRYYTQCSVLQ